VQALLLQKAQIKNHLVPNHFAKKSIPIRAHLRLKKQSSRGALTLKMKCET
jgi:hypothetical protein